MNKPTRAMAQAASVLEDPRLIRHDPFSNEAPDHPGLFRCNVCGGTWDGPFHNPPGHVQGCPLGNLYDAAAKAEA